MKKLALISISALLLTACFEQKTQFQQAVFKQLNADQDIKDYALDADEMSRCIVDTVAKKMPGFFSFEPQRQPIYAGYTKLITLKSSGKPEETLKELREIFGPGDAIAKAQLNYSESVLSCFWNLVSKANPDSDINSSS